ncbi:MULTISPECIES: hypothetical protein [unclassified Cryobacterium]|uniref:hypothetical protein n=1 Tax=unclassified Cryobacterium TaxID=2649013 RepID=UPI002AB3BB00|nr:MULTISPECIES: hypothetical protein [unclassified Cryobacterium]MDY7543031.1 hypothetical protein [Cryobacterium sp. 5B3]MEB0000364.1 hypothetical protein [Cryobacterium sp. RTS3]MEB0266078.1 hypothetical protein [Cryobacterium sp. 10I5]MEB0274026.1 hypothetical protein [Cryobacterium sp. 5B3]
MDISAESAQLISAEQLRRAARELAHSTRTVEHAGDSYELLGRLMNAQCLLGQVFEQLATWHAHTQDGIQYDGEDGRGAGQVAGVIRAELALRDAADLADKADDALMLALTANGVIRWHDYP